MTWPGYTENMKNPRFGGFKNLVIAKDLAIGVLDVFLDKCSFYGKIKLSNQIKG